MRRILRIRSKDKMPSRHQSGPCYESAVESIISDTHSGVKSLHAATLASLVHSLQVCGAKSRAGE
jgi:hypothetical protein